ncbi:MAG: four helix bundle protein [Chitinophagaceae bacterium]|nr:four helix bundle protein [Chitinophagaceae bacterium]
MHTLEDLEVYDLSQDFSDPIWFMVDKWENFAKFGIGKQMTAAADSISANKAEGYGRFFIKENINFCFYSRGSILETKNWLQKSARRNLVDKEEYDILVNLLEIIHEKLNGYIKVLKENLNKQKKD